MQSCPGTRCSPLCRAGRLTSRDRPARDATTLASSFAAVSYSFRRVAECHDAGVDPVCSREDREEMQTGDYRGRGAPSGSPEYEHENLEWFPGSPRGSPEMMRHDLRRDFCR